MYYFQQKVCTSLKSAYTSRYSVLRHNYTLRIVVTAMILTICIEKGGKKYPYSRIPYVATV